MRAAALSLIALNCANSSRLFGVSDVFFRTTRFFSALLVLFPLLDPGVVGHVAMTQNAD